MDVSNATLYGKGIFTTIDIRDNEPYLWDKHWRRLQRDAEKVGLDLSEYGEDHTLEALREAIAESTITVGRARITFRDEQRSLLWSPGDIASEKTSLSVITGERRQKPDLFRVTVSPFPVNSRSPLAGVKSCNYLENLLALADAKQRGFDEAIRLNENRHVTSGCMSNLFWMKDGKLYTPALSTGCVPGTTREAMIESLPCEEVEAVIDDVLAADYVSFHSAGLDMATVAEIDGIAFKSFPAPFGRSGE